MEDTTQPDSIDILIKVGTFVVFIVFGICMWVVKREMNKKKAASPKDVNK
jgi:hypothetical protein